MGSLSLPGSGQIYLDTNCVIYSVEKIAPYDSLLEPAWQAAELGQIDFVSSELVVLETLVKPIRDKDDFMEPSIETSCSNPRRYSSSQLASTFFNVQRGLGP